MIIDHKNEKKVSATINQNIRDILKCRHLKKWKTDYYLLYSTACNTNKGPKVCAHELRTLHPETNINIQEFNKSAV